MRESISCNPGEKRAEPAGAAIRRASRHWLSRGLKEGAIVLAAVGALSCSPLAQTAPETKSTSAVRQAPQPSIVLQTGRASAGQQEISLQEAPQGHVRAVANLSPQTAGSFYWQIYQRFGTGGYHVLNPSADTPGTQKFIGLVMRDAVLTTGKTGDFVVSVQPNPQGTFDPITEQDGKVRPEFVLFELRQGTFEPLTTPKGMQGLRSCSWVTKAPDVMVPEYGPTAAALVVLPP